MRVLDKEEAKALPRAGWSNSPRGEFIWTDNKYVDIWLYDSRRDFKFMEDMGCPTLEHDGKLYVVTG